MTEEATRQTLLLPEMLKGWQDPMTCGECPAGTLRGIGETMGTMDGDNRVDNALSMRSRLLNKLSENDGQLWRGLLAVALLHDTWQEDSEVTVMTYDGTSSAFAQAALNSVGRTVLHLVVLRKGKLSGVLGIADAELGLIPPATGETLAPMLPRRVEWYDRKKGVWHDPCAFLNQRDRLTLAARLDAMGGEALQAFATDLRRREEDVQHHALSEEGSADWQTALKAVAGLAQESEFGQLTARTLPYRISLEGNPLLRCLGVEVKARVGQQPQVQYLWGGHLFARSHEQLGVEPIPGAALEELKTEEALIEEQSRRYAHDLSERLGAYVSEHGVALLPAAADEIRRWQTEVRDRSMAPAAPLELNWPWSEHSPALLLLLREAVGDGLAESLLAPFTEQLTLMHNAALGDAALGLLCRVTQEDGDYLALPPISEKLAEQVARHGWPDGRRLSECLQVTMQSWSVTITLRLRGAGEVLLRRSYLPEQLHRWGAEQVPEIALWPSVPLPVDRWHAYWLVVRGNIGLRCLCNGVWSTYVPEEDGERIMQTYALPSCVALAEDGVVLGALCYEAPMYHPAYGGDAMAALDFGASGTAMALSVGGQNQRVEIPALLHVLLQSAGAGSHEPLPLPAYPMGPIVSSAVVLRHERQTPELFEDGFICPEQIMPQEAMTELIWRSDDAAVAARQLLFQQAMLLASLHAVMCGGERISWYAMLPSTMGRESREGMQQELQRAANRVAHLTGLMPASGAAVNLQRESICAGLYLRDSGLMQGPFAMLTIGAADASMALWLRGMNRPAVEFHESSGILSMLMPALSAHPSLLAVEFAGVGGLGAEEWMLPREDSLSALSQRQMVVERLLGTCLQESQYRMDTMLCQGSMTRTQALLLLGFASLMTLTGHALEQVRRNPLLNDYLPMELQICLCGRGALVLTGMNPGLTNVMAGFVRLPLSLDHPVRALRMTVSGCHKMETVLGVSMMHPAAAVEVADHLMADVMPLLHLMARFLMQFQAVYPQAGTQLFPGMFDATGNYTQAAENLITEAVLHQNGNEDMEHRFLQCLEEIRQRFEVPEKEEQGTQQQREEKK